MAVHNENNIKEKEINYKKSFLVSMAVEIVLFESILIIGYLIPHEVFRDLIFNAKRWSGIYLLSLTASMFLVLLDVVRSFAIPYLIQYHKNKKIINYKSIMGKKIKPAQPLKEKFFRLIAKISMVIAFILFVFSQVILYVFVL